MSDDVHSNSIHREPAEETILNFAVRAGWRASISAVVEYEEQREIRWRCLSCAAIWRSYNLYNDAPTSLPSACIEMTTVDTGGRGSEVCNCDCIAYKRNEVESYVYWTAHHLDS